MVAGRAADDWPACSARVGAAPASIASGRYGAAAGPGGLTAGVGDAMRIGVADAVLMHPRCSGWVRTHGGLVGDAVSIKSGMHTACVSAESASGRGGKGL